MSLIFLLENTGMLVRLHNRTIKRETDLTVILKEFLFIVFPQGQEAVKEYFAKSFTYYFPDIVIRELKATIELKYIDSRGDLKTVFGEIAQDAQVSTGAAEYEVFHAVFYLTSGFRSRERFMSE